MDFSRIKNASLPGKHILCNGVIEGKYCGFEDVNLLLVAKQIVNQNLASG